MIKKQLETEKDLNVTQEVCGLAARPASARLLEAARQTPQEVFAAYETTPQGQPRPDIMRALFGRNELARKKADSILKRLFKAFINPFTVVLIVLAVISFITDYVIVEPEDRDLTAVLIVGIMVFISGTLRFVQEVRSGNAAERLQAMVKTTIAVLRDGESRERPISELVVGDVIRLAAGDMIPADVRIVEAKDLFVSQSSLTGESEPMEKWTAAQPQTGGNPLECNNLAFMGSTVVSGSALALVIAVGKDTLFGALARRVAETRVRTNFEKGVNAVSWVLIRFMVGMVPVVLFLNGFTKGDWVQAALFALSVAVGLTPEMLPMIVSANLAKGAVAMSRKKVIVKHLNAIQNLGAMNILCTDKTGTLTQDRIVLEYPLDVHGNVDERVLRHAFLNSYHQTGLRNLMDEAIVDHAYETNMLPLWQDYRKVDEIPFDFTRRRMSVVVADKAGKTQIITKGAVEEMLSICSYAEYKGNVEPLTSALSEEILATVRRYNEAGLRVIAVAHKTNPMVAGAFSVADESDMVLIGYLAFLDPPKDSAAAAVAALKEYGVAVKVLTGDNDAVTRSVCGQVGLRSHSLLLGSDVEAMDDAALRAAAERTDIFAKLTPQQKARIVTCLRENGHRGFHGRRHQRRGGDEGFGRGDFGGFRRGHRPRIRRHHPAGKGFDGAGAGRDRGPQDLRQHHQVHQDDGKLQLRQHVLGIGGERVSAVPAAGPAADPRAEPHLRHFVHGHAVGQRRCGFPEAAEDMGRFIDQPVYDLVRARQFGIRHHDVRSAVYLHLPAGVRGGV